MTEAYLTAQPGDEVLVIGSGVIPDGWHPVLQVRENVDYRVYVPLPLRPDDDGVVTMPLGSPWGVSNRTVTKVRSAHARHEQAMRRMGEYSDAD